MSGEQKFFNSYYPSAEDVKIDQDTEEKMAVLEDIFSSNDSYSNDDDFNLTKNLPFQDTASYSKINPDLIVDNTTTSDPLDKTQEIDNVELEELRRLKDELRKLDDSADEKSQETNSSQSKGKQKVLTANPKIKYSEDINQIVTSFISCFALAFVTASIGAGWLLYLVNHLI